MELKVFGCDFETVKGEPRLFTAFDGNNPRYLRVTKRTVFPKVLEFIGENAVPHHQNIFFFHNLKHDLVAFLYDACELFKQRHFTLSYRGYQMEVFFYDRIFAYITCPDGTRVRILDTSAFFAGSLDRLASDLHLPVRKMSRPEGIGERDPIEFLEYALRDAQVTYYLAQFILKLHRQYDVTPSVSAPQLAARIFHRLFLKGGSITIECPPPSWIGPTMESYKGGKNGLYLRPGFYRNVTYADIVSAYPWAMTVVPACVEGAGKYLPVSRWAGPSGIYRVSGVVRKTRTPLFFGNGFDGRFGPVKDYMITGPELKIALLYDVFRLEQCEGIVWKSESDTVHPLRDYARTFFRKKNDTRKGDPQHHFYKLMLNSLYGKFVEKIPIEDDVPAQIVEIEPDRSFRPGALFNPFIGSLITGLVRAKMFELETKYWALHTATDSLISRRRIQPSPKSLGSLQPQYHGDILLLRKKLYVIFDPNTGEVLHYALHGFQGSVEDLLDLWKSRTKSYTVRKMNSVRESLRRGLVPLLFEDREMTLHFDWDSLAYE